MVAKKTNIENFDENGRTPLLNFIINEEIELISKTLDEHKWDTCLPDKYGRNALHYILMIDSYTTKKSAEILRNLTDTIIDFFHKKDLNLSDDQGLTALHYACIHNKHKAIIALMEKGAYKNIKDNTGKTALHYASMYGSVKSLQNLLLYSADVSVVDNDHNTALHLACIRNNKTSNHCMELLCANMSTPIICKTNNSGKTAIHLACIYLNDEFTLAYILQLLTDKIDINDLDSENRTALHYGLILHNYEYVKVILQENADIDFLDKSIQMCLNSNVPYEDNKDIVKLLMLYLYDQCKKNNFLDRLFKILVSDRPKKYYFELNYFYRNMKRPMTDVFKGQCCDNALLWIHIIKNEMYPFYGDMMIEAMQNLTLNENEIR